MANYPPQNPLFLLLVPVLTAAALEGAQQGRQQDGFPHVSHHLPDRPSIASHPHFRTAVPVLLTPAGLQWWEV